MVVGRCQDYATQRGNLILNGVKCNEKRNWVYISSETSKE